MLEFQAACNCANLLLEALMLPLLRLRWRLLLLQVTAHPNCSISLRIHVPEGSDKDEFILNGLAVAPFGHQTRAHIDRLAFQYQSRMA